MSQFESLLWECRSRSDPHSRASRDLGSAQAGSLAEWTARPLGRLGRPLLADIEAYLQFFAIARSKAGRATQHP